MKNIKIESFFKKLFFSLLFTFNFIACSHKTPKAIKKDNNKTEVQVNNTRISNPTKKNKNRWWKFNNKKKEKQKLEEQKKKKQATLLLLALLLSR